MTTFLSSKVAQIYVILHAKTALFWGYIFCNRGGLKIVIEDVDSFTQVKPRLFFVIDACFCNRASSRRAATIIAYSITENNQYKISNRKVGHRVICRI